MDKICPICNNDFQSKRSDAVCCSKICGTKLWKRDNKDKVMENKKRHSRTEKAKKSQKIRATRWYNKHKKGEVKSYKKICGWCNNKFIAHRSDKIYCSTKCANSYWKENNKENIKLYNEKNKDKKNKQNNKWKRNNPEKRLNQKHKRRSLCKTTDITSKWLKELKENAIFCLLCKNEMNEDLNNSKQKHLDHIIPLNIGGTHIMSNVRYICRDCNLKRPKDGSDLTLVGKKSLP